MLRKDRVFGAAFSSLFVYNILFEDSEVDERFLGIDEGSTVLGISGAGCGLATMLARRPARIDAVDINPHHLALAALKMQAAAHMESYAGFYEMFGRGFHPRAGEVVRGLAAWLPAWMQRYWRLNHGVFRRSFYRTGLSAAFIELMRKQVGVDGSWLRWLMTLPNAARWEVVDEWFGPVLSSRWARTLMGSPLQLLALGVNYAQLERMLAADSIEDLARFLLLHVKRLVTTDLERNWFAWYFVDAGFNHDHPEGVPPYLRKDHHERSLGAPTVMRFHRCDMFKVLGHAGSRTWSHYNFLDAPDWMPAATQRRLLEEVVRTGRPGAIVLSRSVEDGSLVERAGMSDAFEEMTEESELASALDRTRQYRRVGLHRLVA